MLNLIPTAGGVGKGIQALSALDLLSDVIRGIAGMAAKPVAETLSPPVLPQTSGGKYFVTADDENRLRNIVIKENFLRGFLRAIPGQENNPDFQRLRLEKEIGEVLDRARLQAKEIGDREFAIEQLKTQGLVGPAVANMVGDVSSQLISSTLQNDPALAQLAVGK